MEGIVHCRFKNDKMCWKILPIEILGALTRLVVFLTFKKAQQNLSERRQHETIYALRHLREKIYFTRPEVERNGQGEVERAGRKWVSPNLFRSETFRMAKCGPQISIGFPCF